MTLLALVSALPEEQAGVLSLLVSPRFVERGGRQYCLGQLMGQSVVLVLSKIGKVAAATTATTLIEHFGASAVVFTGVAGGVGAGVAVGDCVVATGFIQHDLDASPLFPAFEVPLYGTTVFPCDPALTARLYRAAVAAAQQNSAGRHVVHQGLVASGDQFVSSAQAASALMDRMQRAGHAPLAVEMEGAAVAQVCYDYGVAFAAYRSISDRADDTAHMDFSRFVKNTASPMALAVAHHLFASQA
jgi:adenosylhomocysteine nucleosidase